MQLEVDDPDQGVFSIDPSMAKRHKIKKEKVKNKSIYSHYATTSERQIYNTRTRFALK